MKSANATKINRKSGVAQWRDLCVDAPSWECFSTEANPDFLPRSTGNDRVCGFQQGKPHEVRQRHQDQQEIRGSGVERSAVCFTS